MTEPYVISADIIRKIHQMNPDELAAMRRKIRNHTTRPPFLILCATPALLLAAIWAPGGWRWALTALVVAGCSLLWLGIAAKVQGPYEVEFAKADQAHQNLR